MSSLRRYLPLLTIGFGIACFYLYDLDGVGMLGPDEPRYAAIGRAMAETCDFVTPKLWGSPWFEKPPLLYWMTAAGTRAGLNAELAGRLPVALLSLFFLAGFFELLRREFGADAAALSTTLLATSAGWVAESSLCLTDLPVAVLFSLAVFIALPLVRCGNGARRLNFRFAGIGVCIGLGALAKGLVPIALALPFAWFLRAMWRKWWIAITACVLVASPWYVTVYTRNGYAFIEEFFIKHHLERLYSETLQHVQPWYYYVPVLLAALFPWTPLLGLLGLRGQAWDDRRRFLATVFLFGFIVFSVSLNKLPGYLLPLMPVLFALLGAHFERKSPAELSRLWLLPSALLIACIPLIALFLPEALAAGKLVPVKVTGISATEVFYIALPIATFIAARRSWLTALLALCVIAGGIYLKTVDDPRLDRRVSARILWNSLKARQAEVCSLWLSRDWEYGLAFYRGAPFPSCVSGHYKISLRSIDHVPPLVEMIPPRPAQP